MFIKRSIVLPLFCIVYLLLFSAICISQDRIQPGEKTRWVNGSGGIMLARVQDKQFSSVRYSGITPAAILNLGYQNSNGFHEAAFSFAQGNLNHEELSSYTMNIRNISARYTYGRRIGSNNIVWQNYVGGSLGYLHNERKYTGFINKSMGGEKTLSLGLMGQSIYHFGATSQWAAQARLTIPFLSYISQDDPGINGQESSKLVSLSKLQLINTAVKLERIIGAASVLTLSYQWDIYKLNYQIALNQAIHRILLGYQFTF